MARSLGPGVPLAAFAIVADRAAAAKLAIAIVEPAARPISSAA